jgi:hypothetical protein
MQLAPDLFERGFSHLLFELVLIQVRLSF